MTTRGTSQTSGIEMRERPSSTPTHRRTYPEHFCGWCEAKRHHLLPAPPHQNNKVATQLEAEHGVQLHDNLPQTHKFRFRNGLSEQKRDVKGHTCVKIGTNRQREQKECKQDLPTSFQKVAWHEIYKCALNPGTLPTNIS